MARTALHDKSFLLLLVIVSLAFVWLLMPFYAAVFWGGMLAILFAPLHRRLLEVLGGRRNLAAASTLLLCLLGVIAPVSLIAVSLVQEGAAFYSAVRSGELDFGGMFESFIAVLPTSIHGLLERFGVADLSSLQTRLSEGVVAISQWVATQALSIGQNTAQFLVGLGIMLYLLYFLLRDGVQLAQKISLAIPLGDTHKRLLLRKFATVVQATIKGNVVVAAVQGTLGGLMFWVSGIQGPLLWGVVMGVLSLLPVVGASLIWGPVAMYFLATGSLWQGVGLIAFGVLVIGMVDNLLRPVLVGKDIQMPDYLVLISTLGGLSLFGLNGFVIGPLIAALFMTVWDMFASDDTRHSD